VCGIGPVKAITGEWSFILISCWVTSLIPLRHLSDSIELAAEYQDGLVSKTMDIFLQNCVGLDVLVVGNLRVCKAKVSFVEVLSGGSRTGYPSFVESAWHRFSSLTPPPLVS